MSELSSSARRVQDALKEKGFEFQVVELAATTRTATEAAQAIGCSVEQIAKSLVFRTKNSGKPVLVVASGSNRVNEKRIAEYLGEAIVRPDADYVRSTTGFSIGGVAPIGHTSAIETFIDEDLLQYDVVWAAAGTPFAVFSSHPSDLPRMTGGRVVSIK